MTVTNSDQTQLDTEIHVEIGQQFLEPEDKPHKFYAPARTISSILEDARVRRIDLFSLDLEGFEAAALRGLDLIRYDIRLFCIETAKVDDVAAVLGERYEMVEKISHHDYLFLKV